MATGPRHARASPSRRRAARACAAGGRSCSPLVGILALAGRALVLGVALGSVAIPPARHARDPRPPPVRARPRRDVVGRGRDDRLGPARAAGPDRDGRRDGAGGGRRHVPGPAPQPARRPVRAGHRLRGGARGGDRGAPPGPRRRSSGSACSRGWPSSARSLATLAVYRLSRIGGLAPLTSLLLTGYAVGSLLAAGLAMAMYLSGAALRQIFSYLLGGFDDGLVGSSSPARCRSSPSGAPDRWSGRGRSTALLLGEEAAAHLGIDVRRERAILLGAGVAGDGGGRRRQRADRLRRARRAARRPARSWARTPGSSCRCRRCCGAVLLRLRRPRCADRSARSRSAS